MGHHEGRMIADLKNTRREFKEDPSCFSSLDETELRPASVDKKSIRDKRRKAAKTKDTKKNCSSEVKMLVVEKSKRT